MEMQIKNLRKQAKMIKRKDAGNCWDRKENATQEKKKTTIQLEEINQKVMAKEGILKRY